MSWDYQREERASSSDFIGKRRCVIVDVEDTMSKTGKKMLVITVRPSGCAFKVKQYIVEGEYFNRNMTQFFDAFPEIGDGNFNILEWIGAEGAAMFAEDDQGYLKIKYFISSDKAYDLPAFEGDKPERQTVAKLEELGESDDDELPFDL